MHPLDHEQHICFRAVEMGETELAYGYEKMWRYVFVPKVGMAGHDNHRMCDCCSIGNSGLASICAIWQRGSPLVRCRSPGRQHLASIPLLNQTELQRDKRGLAGEVYPFGLG